MHQYPSRGVWGNVVLIHKFCVRGVRGPAALRAPVFCAAHETWRPRSLYRANYACRPGYAYEYGQYSINCVRTCSGWLCDSQWMGTQLRCFRCPTLTFMTGSRIQWDTTQTTVTQVLTAATAGTCRRVPRPLYTLAEY